jgi:hypothetical protein
MHPRLLELTNYLDEQRAVLAAAVDEVPEGLRTAVPPPGGWSTAHVLEHVLLVERRIAGFFRVWLAEARANGLEHEDDPSPILPTINTAGVVNRTRKVVALPAVEPTGQMSVEESVRGIDDVRRELKAVLAEGDGLALSKIVKPHPVLQSLTMYEWIGFVGSHMGRHAAQIREIRQQLDGQAV